MVTIKLIVTPLLMLAASLAARRWGSFVGGVFSDLPLTSGPISLYLAIEQRGRFVQRAAAGSLAGLSAVMLAYLCYISLSARCSLLLTCGVSLVIFCLSSWLLLTADLSVLPVMAGAFAIVLVLCFTRAGLRSSFSGRPSRLDLPMRLCVATLMVLMITALARVLGPGISGVLSPVPVIAWPLTVFAHVQGGRKEALAVIRGNAAGGAGIIVFYVFVEKHVAVESLTSTFLIAVILSIVSTFVVACILTLKR